MLLEYHIGGREKGGLGRRASAGGGWSEKVKWCLRGESGCDVAVGLWLALAAAMFGSGPVAGKMVAVVAMRLVVGVDGDSGKEGGMGDRWLQLRDYSHCQNSWHFKIIDLR